MYHQRHLGIIAILGQIGLDPKAAWTASMLYFVLVAICLVMLLSVAAALVMAIASSRGRRILFRKIVLIPVGLLAVALVLWQLLPRRLAFDLSQGPQLSAVHWPDKRLENWYSYSGKIHVIVLLPDKHKYETRAARIWIDRWDNQIRGMEIFTEPLTLQAALDRVRVLCQEWSIVTPDLDQWRMKIQAGDLSPFGACLQRSKAGEIGVEIRPTFNKERPCLILFRAYWPKPNGTNPGEKLTSSPTTTTKGN